jgi:hypothetical protein
MAARWCRLARPMLRRDVPVDEVLIGFAEQLEATAATGIFPPMLRRVRPFARASVVDRVDSSRTRAGDPRLAIDREMCGAPGAPRIGFD